MTPADFGIHEFSVKSDHLDPVDVAGSCAGCVSITFMLFCHLIDIV